MAGLLELLPWVPVGLAVSLAAAAALGGPLARSLGARPAIGWLLVIAVGLIVSATLTPLRGQFAGPAALSSGCDLARFVPPTADDLASHTDAALNIVLFIPLGIAAALVPAGRRGVVLIGAAFLPLLIEIVQLAAVPLGRGCQSADVVDNLIGLALGVAMGTLASHAWRRRA